MLPSFQVSEEVFFQLGACSASPMGPCRETGHYKPIFPTPGTGEPRSGPELSEFYGHQVHLSH